MLKILKKINNLLSSVEYKIANLLLVAIFVLIISSVSMRYLIHISIDWSEMLARYLLVWLVSLSILPAFKNNSHIGIDVLTAFLTDKWKRRVHIFIDLLMLAFFGVVAVYGIKYSIFANSMRATFWNLSLLWVYMTVPIFSISAILYLVEDCFSLFVKESKN